MPDASGADEARRDESAIVDVGVRYAHALDTKDWTLLATCFTDDAVVEFEGMDPAHGLAELIETCSGVLDRLDASQHLLGNFWVEVRGDEASSRCSLQAQHVKNGAPGGALFTVGGTYHDQLRRSADGWRITSRRLEVIWTDGNPAIIAAGPE